MIAQSQAIFTYNEVTHISDNLRSVKQCFRALLGVTVTVSSETCQCDLSYLYHVYLRKIASNNNFYFSFTFQVILRTPQR